jgi:hypothetical protein
MLVWTTVETIMLTVTYALFLINRPMTCQNFNIPVSMLWKWLHLLAWLHSDPQHTIVCLCSHCQIYIHMTAGSKRWVQWCFHQLMLCLVFHFPVFLPNHDNFPVHNIAAVKITRLYLQTVNGRCLPTKCHGWVVICGRFLLCSWRGTSYLCEVL